jgi:hypothetical protein
MPEAFLQEICEAVRDVSNASKDLSGVIRNALKCVRDTEITKNIADILYDPETIRHGSTAYALYDIAKSNPVFQEKIGEKRVVSMLFMDALLGSERWSLDSIFDEEKSYSTLQKNVKTMIADKNLTDTIGSDRAVHF